MAMYTIGQVARHSGVGVETVRFIQRSKALGFSLREIGDLLSLRVDQATTCTEVRKRAVKDAKVTLNPPRAVVMYDPAKVNGERLVDATTRAGFPSTIVNHEGGTRR